jgi:hypothetical protein
VAEKTNETEIMIWVLKVLTQIRFSIFLRNSFQRLKRLKVKVAIDLLD